MSVSYTHLWGFHMDGQVGQGFGQDGIDHALVIGNAAVDQAVEIIRIVNILSLIHI